MSNSDGASEIYAKLLLREKLGYPLWYPDLDENLPVMYRDNGIGIGDVGSITGAGQFEFYFSVHDCNSRFQLWPRPETSFSSNMRPPGTVIRRGSVTDVTIQTEGSAPVSGACAGVEITCSTDKSAILVLPDGACCENLKRPAKFLDRLTDELVLQWLEFTESPSLLLVTGYIKTRTWGVAAISNTSGRGSVCLRFKALEVGGRFTGMYSWQNTSDGHHRVGPIPPAGVPNQCVFLRGYKLSSRKSLGLFGKLKAKVTDISGFKMHEAKDAKRSGEMNFRDNRSTGYGAPGNSQQNRGAFAEAIKESETVDEVFIESTTDTLQGYHPSDVINAHLLEEVPDAEVAVTHDDEWCALIKEDDEDFLDNSELLRRVRQRYKPLLKSGCVRLIPQEIGEIESMSSVRQDDVNEDREHYKSQQSSTGSVINYREELNNHLQETFRDSRSLTWVYQLLERKPPWVWEAIAYIRGVEYGRSVAPSKAKAKEAAARMTLLKLRSEERGEPISKPS